MRILVIAEHQDLAVTDGLLNILGGLRPLDIPIDIMVAGHGCDSVAHRLSELTNTGLANIAKVLCIDAPEFLHQPEDLIAKAISVLASDYSHICCAASAFGKALVPRIAAHLGVAAITGVAAIESADEFVRPLYAGRLMARVKSLDPLKVFSVLVSSMPVPAQAAVTPGASPAPIVQLRYEPSGNTARVEFISEKRDQSRRRPLQAAQVIVSAGRGLGSKANVDELELLADKLDAAVGATRAVVDAGWLTNDKQIGQTAKIVAPELYIALGISGATQHLAGMKDSRVIIAVNKDCNAPIFQVADYGFVGDLNEVLPRLNAML